MELPYFKTTHELPASRDVISLYAGDRNLWLFTHFNNGGTGYVPTPAKVDAGRFADPKPNFYHDAMYTVYLVQEQTKIACIGFNVLKSTPVAVVQQIQSHRGTENLMKDFRWEKLLLHSLTDFLLLNTLITEVRVVVAEDNRWFRATNDKSKDGIERRERLKMRYDVTAKRMGFKKSARKCHSQLPAAMNPFHYYSMTRAQYRARHVSE